MLIDARSVDDGGSLQFDLAVIGGGPAGISLGHRLRDSGLRIGILEAGGSGPEIRSQRLYRGEVVGRPYFALDACRYRILGGSSCRWGGWCRPLDEADFRTREWIPHSGWPISETDLAPLYPDTAQLLELTTADFSLAHWVDRLPRPLQLGGEEFEHSVFQYSPPTNFADRWGPELFTAGNVTTVTHANVTELVLDPGGDRIASASVRTLSGRSFTVSARAFVLAAGGIENARLLLASRDQRPAGIGNQHDVVGRFFMDHPHLPIGHAVTPPGQVITGFYDRAAYGDAIVRGVIRPRHEALAARRLPSCSISIQPWSGSIHTTALVGWSPYLATLPLQVHHRLSQTHPHTATVLRRAAARAWSTARVVASSGQGVALRLRQRRMGDGQWNISALYLRTEQLPNPASRVTIGNRRDEVGVPLPRLDWQLGATDHESILTWLGALDHALATTGGRVEIPADDWESAITGGPHHIGTTRMSADPRSGVVDADCRVHSVSNLYVAGSSVFPTSGTANPTFTIVALALRLADHLAGVLA